MYISVYSCQSGTLTTERMLPSKTVVILVIGNIYN